MANNFKNVGTVIGGDGDPSNGDGLCTNLSLFPINSVYINNTTGKVWSRDAAAGVAADWVGQSGGSSYLVYTALLSQSGTNAPVATVLENTLGGTVVWTRVGAGDYFGTLAGAFVNGIIPNFYQLSLDPGSLGFSLIPLYDFGISIIGYYGIWFGDNNLIAINVFDSTFNLVDWSTLVGTSPLMFDIKTFPI
jgi:hypothetical protein